MDDTITITVANETELVLVDVVLGHVNNPGLIGDVHRVGDLASGTSTTALPIPENQANYRMVSALVDGKRHRFVTFDFTELAGSKNLPAGSYTFRITATPDRWLELEIDQHGNAAAR